ncbi:hypothetical protein [Dactylosporangium darangshiense]
MPMPPLGRRVLGAALVQAALSGSKPPAAALATAQTAAGAATK